MNKDKAMSNSAWSANDVALLLYGKRDYPNRVVADVLQRTEGSIGNINYKVNLFNKGELDRNDSSYEYISKGIGLLEKLDNGAAPDMLKAWDRKLLSSHQEFLGISHEAFDRVVEYLPAEKPVSSRVVEEIEDFLKDFPHEESAGVEEEVGSDRDEAQCDDYRHAKIEISGDESFVTMILDRLSK